MKAIKIIIGLAGGVYAALQVRHLVQLLQAKETTDYRSSTLLGCLAGICLGAALCIGLLRSAFKKPSGKGAEPGDRSK